jgi:hypothetical protein
MLSRMIPNMTRTDAMRPVRLRQARDSDLRIVAAYFTN